MRSGGGGGSAPSEEHRHQERSKSDRAKTAETQRARARRAHFVLPLVALPYRLRAAFAQLPRFALLFILLHDFNASASICAL